ncbi:MAG: hypothetical protein SFV81_18265, partial [Pirellulaceae bacterium]|nr:hypothetical protein [Pirellulaceae bacterium]
VEELLGIPVNTGINPTNAVVTGAAYFAATKEVYLDEGAAHETSRPGDLKVRVAYNRASQEHEEMFSARVDGEVAGLFYRIRREDGGYDSGLKELTTRIVEDLPLQADAYNFFSFTIYNASNNPVPTDLDPIQIAQGKYSVAGQIVPHDLSLVRDDIDANDTKLDCIFAKNTVIPSRAKRTCQVNRTISRSSADEAIHVIVVEGPSENHPYVNRKQGILRIAGDQLKQDARRGTDIDLTFELSESRELTVTANINSQDFSQVFGPQYRELQAGMLADELKQLATQIDEEQDEAVANEHFEIAQEIGKLRSEIHKLQDATANIPPNSVTDEKLKIDNDKRDVAQKLDRLTAGKRLQRLRADYQAAKKDVTNTVTESGNDLERRQLREVVTREHTFLDSAKAKKLEVAISELRHLEFQILQRKPEFLVGLFQYLLDRREAFNDQLQAKTLIEAGKRYVAAEDFDRLFEVMGRLFQLLPEEDTDESGPGRFFRGTGIS